MASKTAAVAMRKIQAFARKQADGVTFCPRCGRLTMKERVATNALSRSADVYICDECGADEALRDWGGNPMPLEEWAIAKLPSLDTMI